jgi:phosphatidylethanolamine-binding protein (PEBP) family uncharacterized protein
MVIEKVLFISLSSITTIIFLIHCLASSFIHCLTCDIYIQISTIGPTVEEASDELVARVYLLSNDVGNSYYIGI